MLKVLIAYANLFYSPNSAGANAQGTNSQVMNALALMAVKRFLNENVLNRLVSSVQIKFLNYFMVAVVQDLFKEYSMDNDHYLSTFVTFCSP